MFNRKNYLLNCSVCDTRKMKEEDYSGYERMVINTDLIIVSASSRSILNRLPVVINQDWTMEMADDADLELEKINGSFEITAATSVREHTLLDVNGSLHIHPGTEEVLEKYEKIYVNGCVKCPKSLEGYLGRLKINGSVVLYPDDCVILEDDFVLDKYFPMRAKEGARYFAEKKVIIQDKAVNLEKLVQKRVQFVTKQLIVPEEMAADCVELFDEKVTFTVIPAGMALHYGDAVLSERLPEKEGTDIYVYGDLKLPEDCDLPALEQLIHKMIVKGTVELRKSQEEKFRKLNMEYDRLEFLWEGRIIRNVTSVKVDRVLLESSPDKVLIRNAAKIKIAPDVPPELILDRLEIKNCAKIFCREEQESAVAAVSRNVARIGAAEGEESPESEEDIEEDMTEVFSAGMINADYYVM